MLLFGQSTKETLTNMKSSEKCLDSQLWHACAGGMVQMPSVNSKVYYFPQGHAEHSQTPVDFGSSSKIPPFVLSRVTSVKFLADPETDEVFAKIRLVPIQQNELDLGEDELIGLHRDGSSELQEKPASFAKTLTQSDANNGGGFSVPRYCAETIFPRLDYSADPPVQTVLAKDVHGEIWKFRHIYRGTPRRHLLTTGWSTFVNQKKLVAGDSIVFLRAENGDLCVGIRRAKRGIGGGPEQASGWNPPAYGGLSVFLREEENKLVRDSGRRRVRSKIRGESVIEAARLASSGQPFEVVYYPRASTPEFCVKAAAVRGAMRVQWCPGMRFKMAFETEDSSRISWFMGTISSVQAADPIQWPNSPWRLLQVTWDEPDLLQNVKRVSPWLVELVSTMPAIHLAPFSPPRKKLRIPDFPPDTQPFSTTTHGPMGIQGARHAHYSSISLSDHPFNKLQPGLFHTGFHHRTLDRTAVSPPAKFSLFLKNKPTPDDDLSCLLTIGSPSMKKSYNGGKKTSQLVLFGQPILTEEQISLSTSGNSLSDVNNEKGMNISSSDESASKKIHHHGEVELGLETGHCKVFVEADGVGRSLDLSDIGSYEQLYGRLADMFGIAKSELLTHLMYHDATGVVKHPGDVPFSEFMKTARRLTLMDSSTDNIGSQASKETSICQMYS